jgi:hypothetical protein
MAEKTTEPSEKSPEPVVHVSESPPTKLQLDRPTDFKFHLAYDVYSKAWDHNSEYSARTKLNELISSLAKNETEYTDFYAQIHEYRADGGGGFRSGKVRIETSKKREWQRTTTRNNRNRRHR